MFIVEKLIEGKILLLMPLALSVLFILCRSWGALGGKQYTTSMCGNMEA